MFEPTIDRAEEETVAFLGMKGPYSQIPEGYETLYGWLGQHGIKTNGSPRAVFVSDPLEVDEDEALWELWAPVCGELAESEPDGSGVGIKRIEPHLFACATHVGDYDEMDALYDQLTEWIAGQGYRIVGPAEEIYRSDPETVPPEEYVTDVRFPIARG